jgi:tripartite-type tricarboxylate transporter receptor subunit TctC
MTITHSLSRREALAALAAFGATAAAPAFAQGAPWPQKAVRLVVPFAPGGSSEVVARAVAAELSKQLGQSVFVENKPGGAGTVAMQEVARSPGDGYNLILGHVGTLAVNPYMLPNQPYDVNRDFAPVTLLAKVPNVLVVHPDVPAKTFKEFIAYAKANPGKLNYSSAGNGSAGHLSMEYLKLTAGFFMTHIPYRGSGPQMTDLLAGRVQVAMNGLPSVSSFIKAGKLRALAVGSAQRVPVLPEVPTIAESGYKGFETSQWYGLLAPSTTPSAIVKRIQEESAKALKTSAVTERFAHDSALGVGDTPEQFTAFIAAQQKIWKEIVAKAGIKAD